ncbi:MAG: helix-turn-helix transcriptional regulator [Acidobacteriaceae bacterium]
MKKLTAWMKRNDLDQTEAAKRLNISQSYLSYILNGTKPSGVLAARIERVTGIPREEIRPDIFGA